MFVQFFNLYNSDNIYGCLYKVERWVKQKCLLFIVICTLLNDWFPGEDIYVYLLAKRKAKAETIRREYRNIRLTTCL